MLVFFHFCITHIFKIFKTFDVNTRMFRNDFLFDTFVFINFFLFRNHFNLHFALYYLHFHDDH